MLPAELTPSAFQAYPPEAERLVNRNLALLRLLPLPLAGLLLKEVRSYDWKFPAELQEVDIQFAYLRSLSSEALHVAMAGFTGIDVPAEIAALDWINLPQVFSQRFGAMLWATNQIGAFRAASVDYVFAYRAAAPVAPLRTRRLTMVAIGQSVKESGYPLFRALQPLGVHYTSVDAPGGVAALLGLVVERSKAYPTPFAHWYVDGGPPLPGPGSGISTVSYTALNPLRLAVLKKMRSMGQTSNGPEGLQETLAGVELDQLPMQAHGGNPVLDRFQLSIFTEGSGTQIFSTTFVQWTAHELLRRAQPLTTFVRFAPRQTQRSMEELLADEGESPVMDAQGALVDADMAAYYIFINQRRLPESEKATFLVWFEDHEEAVMISPAHPPGTTSHVKAKLDRLLEGA